MSSTTTAQKEKPSHLCIRPLSIYDLDQVNRLEEAGFPENERASREKLKYRLTVCPELCSGLFVREFETHSLYNTNRNNNNNNNSTTKDELPPPHSTITKETLIGHIIATKMVDSTVTDRSMMLPQFIKSSADDSNSDCYIVDKSIKGNDQIGHVESGKTIGIHSVTVDSKYRGLKLASLLLKDYLQKMNQQFVGDKVALIAKEELCPFYEGLGFIDGGVSDCQHGGEVWHDLFTELRHEEDEDDM